MASLSGRIGRDVQSTAMKVFSQMLTDQVINNVEFGVALLLPRTNCKCVMEPHDITCPNDTYVVRGRMEISR